MQPQQVIGVMLIDHHHLLRRGVSVLLETYSDFRVIGEAASASEALRLLDGRHLDVVVLDMELRGEPQGIDLIRTIRRQDPQARVLVLTNIVDSTAVQQALRAGATGYILKTVQVDELAQAIRATHHGVPMLSPEVTQLLIQESVSPAQLARNLTGRERQVLQLMARGYNNLRIATELHVSLSTVQFHVSNILDKLDVHNRTEAAAFALKHQYGLGST